MQARAPLGWCRCRAEGIRARPSPAVSLPGGGHAGAGPSGGAFGRGAGHGVHTLRLCHSERSERSERSRRIRLAGHAEPRVPAPSPPSGGVILSGGCAGTRSRRISSRAPSGSRLDVSTTGALRPPLNMTLPESAPRVPIGARFGSRGHISTAWQRRWPPRRALAGLAATGARSGRTGCQIAALPAGDARARLGGHQELAVSLPGGGHAGAGPSGGAFGRGAGHGVHTLRLCHSERRARSARSRRISSRARTESQRDVRLRSFAAPLNMTQQERGRRCRLGGAPRWCHSERSERMRAQSKNLVPSPVLGRGEMFRLRAFQALRST